MNTNQFLSEEIHFWHNVKDELASCRQWWDTTVEAVTVQESGPMRERSQWMNKIERGRRWDEGQRGVAQILMLWARRGEEMDLGHVTSETM